MALHCNAMSSTHASTARPLALGPSTCVRRHRKRRRKGLHLFTVEVPEANIENAIARGLLKPEDCVEPWSVVQTCYASQLSGAALEWLIEGKIITPKQRSDAAG